MDAHREPAPVVDDDDERQVFHHRLALFNRQRLAPGLAPPDWRERLENEFAMRVREGGFVESERRRIAAIAAKAPGDPFGFGEWFKALERNGPGQGDALFPWLAGEASLSQMRWFLSQEVSGEAGFDDLVAMTQVKMPARAKLELARNFWDEAGRGDVRAVHGDLLHRLSVDLALSGSIDGTVWESLALGNLMVALAANRRYAFHSLGALGAIELTAPGRVAQVDRGLKRLGISARSRQYYTLHATLDVAHAQAWISEVLRPIIASEPLAAPAIAEGALMRLAAGQRCFERYRRNLMPERVGAST